MSNTRAARIADLSHCPCTGTTLDRFIQPAILAVLAAGPLHGYRLAERIGRLPGFAGHKPDISGVYRFLKAMERKGLVESSWDVSTDAPPKRAYHITPAGRRCLRLWSKTLTTYRESVTELLKVVRKATKE